MIKIITDSTCDLPKPFLDQYDIDIVPLHLLWGEEQYIDGVTITNEAFYKRLPDDPVHPSTSQPSPADFEKAYAAAEAEGASEILCFTIAKELSGTFQSAAQAAENAKAKVHCFNSGAISQGLGWQVLAAARCLQAGGKAEEALQAAQLARENMVSIVGLQTLEYLIRGGRLSSAFRWVGSALSLKPLLVVDHQAEKINLLKMQRTQRGLIRETVKEFGKRLKKRENLRIGILHGSDDSVGKELAAAAEQEFKPLEVIMAEYGPVLGVHAGPGGFAMIGYGE